MSYVSNPVLESMVSDTAVTDVVSDLSVSMVDAPSGYSVSWDTDPIDGVNEEAAGFSIAGGEDGQLFRYTITSDEGGTPVSASGTLSSDDHAITGVDVSGLEDGTLTVAVWVSDPISGLTGPDARATVEKDTSGG